MADTALTAEQILQAAEDVLRRYGPSKATVVDVARALGVSHGSVYRHFATKAALREAVTQRWLVRAHNGLAELAAENGPAPERLRRWLAALFAAKRRKAFDDPEMFATYQVIAGETSTVVPDHIDRMVDQIASILADGVARSELRALDAQRTARAIFDATNRFHDPVYAQEWNRPGIDDAFDAVCELIVAGLAKS